MRAFINKSHRVRHSEGQKGQEGEATFFILCNKLFVGKIQLKLFAAYVKCNGTVIERSKKDSNSFSEFKFLLNSGDLVFWFVFNHGVRFRLKMAVTF